jgi:hypothetical protein
MSQDRWAENWNYAGGALEPSLALFRASRGQRRPVGAANSGRVGALACDPIAATWTDLPKLYYVWPFRLPIKAQAA